MSKLDDTPGEPQSRVGKLMKELYFKAKKRDFTPTTRQLGENEEPISEPQYEQIFREDCDYLGPDFLDESALMNILAYLKRHCFALKEIFHDEMTLGVGVFPTSEVGSDLTNDEIKCHSYFRGVHINKDGLTEDFILLPGRYFDVMPHKMQKACSMRISYSEKESQFITEKELEGIYNFFIDSFNAWREFFGKEKVKVPYYTSR